MPIQFQCDCGQKYSVKEEFAGKKTSCRQCGEVVQIPNPAKSTRPKPKAKPKPAEDEWDETAFEEEEDEDFEAAIKPKEKKAGASLPIKKSKGKSKKQRTDQPDGVPTGMIIAMVAGAAVVLLGGIGFLTMNIKGEGAQVAGGGAAVAAAVPKLAEVRNDLGNFAIAFPDGWDIKTGGGSGGMPPFATAESGSIYLSVKSDQHATALLTTSQNFDSENSRLEDFPVHRAHELVKVKLEAEFDAYEETAPKLISTKYGDGRISEFTAQEGLFSKTKGLRATFLSNAWCLKITCKCPQKEFPKNEALFCKVIESFSN